MPTFATVALDRLLEPGDSTSRGDNSKRKPPRDIPNSNLGRWHSIATVERKVKRPQLKPELYATPEATPLPDSPTSLTPSPYIINHKRRGPRLLKSFSEDDVASRAKSFDQEKADDGEKEEGSEGGGFSRDDRVTFSVSGSGERENGNGVHDREGGSSTVDFGGGNEERSDVVFRNGTHGNGSLIVESNSARCAASSPQRDSENEDFFDPLDSLSYASNTSDGEENIGARRGLRSAAKAGEFYDAWDELSSDGGTQSATRDVEAELREIRLSLLMEIEKRKQAEEDLNNMQRQWEKIRQQLFPLGLTLPACPRSSNEDEQLDDDTLEELCQQVTITRYVSESIGRGLAKAEAEIDMEAQIELKNFEIARLLDRLHYYEAVNQEMSHRNQEAIENARINRQKRKRKQKKLFWGSITTIITVGTAALLWSYLPTGRGSTSTNLPEAYKDENSSK